MTTLREVVTFGDRFVVRRNATFRIETADGEVVITGECSGIEIEPTSPVTTFGWPYDATTTLQSFQFNIVMPHPEEVVLTLRDDGPPGSVETGLPLSKLQGIATIEARPKTRAGLIEL